MEKETRSAIERATQRARRLLEEDFAAQLESAFDVLPSGEVAPAPGAHLTSREAKQRERIVAAIAHKRAAGMTAAEAVADYVRDAAFTTLNRFAALKMLEARGLVQECVSKGEQSSGYREFCGLAPGVALLPDGAGYRLYVESLFDELSTEIKVLFDRRDPASVLWPRRATFTDLLDAFNHRDLGGVWTDDETIGWVYQYFNSKEERAAMRDPKQGGSQAPRNSRELAVRNQFFTPRYVVEFLVDNTLGRTWVEMHGRGSRLTEQCRYFVRTEDETRTRPRKDPRDLRVLDPACGSGHFLLYAFDLLLTIYEEAWATEEAPRSDATGRTLREDYGDLGDLRRAVPALIVEHNLHGVDIDPRAAQIAALALWLRAQRAWKNLGVVAAQRPRISRTHIVVAEPMPGDATLVEEFAAKLNPPLLRDLFRRMVAEMRLAGELGTLLPIEQSLTPAQSKFDLSGTADERFFHEAESHLLDALREFAEGAGGMAGGARVRHRLFAGDAAQGIALIDLLRRRFDVVLMNPPFGEVAEPSRDLLALRHPVSVSDVGAVFVERGLALMTPDGLLGAITNRTLLAIQSFAGWRERLLADDGLVALVDLGHGVLDAMVETAMYVCRATGHSREQRGCASFLGLLESGDKKSDLEDAFNRRIRASFKRVATRTFQGIPGAPWAYWVPPRLLERFTQQLSFASLGGTVCVGTQTGDDFRFLRLRWEVLPEGINSCAPEQDPGFEQHRWVPLVKGGEYGLWWDDVHLVQDWAHDGRQVKSLGEAGGTRSFPKNLDRMFARGGTYPYRTTSALALRLLPQGCAFSVGGWGVFPPSGWSDEQTLAVFNTRFARYFLEVLLGQGDSSASGTAARNHGAGVVGGIPWPSSRPATVDDSIRQLIDITALSRSDETGLFFRGSVLFPSRSATFEQLASDWWSWMCAQWATIAELTSEVEKSVKEAYGFAAEELEVIAAAEGTSIFDLPESVLDPATVSSFFRATVEELTRTASQVCGSKRYIVKKAYYVDRCIDLVAHALRAHPRSVIEAARLAGVGACAGKSHFAEQLLSWVFGLAVGRFCPKSDNPRGPAEWTALPRVGLEQGEGISVWVDDPGHPKDLVGLVQVSSEGRWGEAAADLLRSASTECASLGPRQYYRDRFFASHLQQYSKSRRAAPIYWQLATPSASYSVWLYAHRVSRDTFYQLQNDIVGPKLLHEEQRLAGLIERAGATPSAPARKEIAAQGSFVEELRSMLDEIKRVAPLWNPDLDDGIVLVMAPLWRLVPQHKAWQKELKSKWDELVAGKYDWAHLAMHLWPERVVPKCAADRSLAIAHGLEDEFWVEGADGKWKARTTPTRAVEQLVRERSSPAVKAALKSLLEAPPPGGGVERRRRVR